mgnify:CR=1 FL=1
MNNIIPFPKRRRQIETTSNESVPKQEAAPTTQPTNPGETPPQFEALAYTWKCWTITEGRTTGGHPTLHIIRTASRSHFPKPKVNYFYHSEERRQQALELFKASHLAKLERRAQRAQERRAACAGGHDLKVGECLYASWGYDQTNIDYYQIVRVSKRSVWFRKIDGRIVKADGQLSSTVSPTKDAFLNAALREGGEHRRSVGAGNAVSYGSRHLTSCAWDAEHHQSSYH